MKKKSACILLVFAAVIVLTYMTGESYYRGISEKAGLDEQEEKIYKYQYDMIVDSPDSQFWQAVYDSAKVSSSLISFVFFISMAAPAPAAASAARPMNPFLSDI